MVVPGRYAVRLTIGEHSQTQPFDILPDPRIKTGAGDLDGAVRVPQGNPGQARHRQRDASTISTPCSSSWRILTRRTRERARSATLHKASSALRGELAAIRCALIDVNCSQAQLWACGLHEKLNALFDTVDSGDFAPARQTREVFAAVSGQLDALLARWRKARERLLPALNRTAAKAKLPVIGSNPKKGEHDVYASEVASFQAGVSERTGELRRRTGDRRDVLQVPQLPAGDRRVPGDVVRAWRDRPYRGGLGVAEGADRGE